MNNFIKIFSLLLLLGGQIFALTVLPGQAQGPPPVGSGQGSQPLDQVDILRMPPVDVPALLHAGEQTPEPFLRFAQPISVTVSPETHGTWDQPKANTRRWRLRIISADALSLNLGFSRYVMPAGGRLLLYTADGEQVIGPFTEADNESHGQLWTPLLTSDDIVIEVTLPAEAKSELELRLSFVNHGYVDITHAATPDKSGACNVDVICSTGDSWRDEIRSVAAYSLGGAIICTGTLINNTAGNLRPYFLTASHCEDEGDDIFDAGDAASMVVYWNYENSTCRTPGSGASGGSGDGPLTQFNTGAIFRAAHTATDFALVELDDPITSTFNVHWAGWDRNGGVFNSATTIHHPSGDEKRISLENDSTSNTSYLGTSSGDSTHIRIADWDLGTTEDGSSGAPLFNINRQVVGQLHGGYAACGNDAADWYGHLSVSWAGGGTAATRLSDWLDPAGSGATTLNGSDAVFDFSLNTSPSTVDVCVPNKARYDIAVGSTLGFSDSVVLSVSGNPAGTGIVWGQNPVTPAGSSALTVTNSSSVTGTYKLNITGVSPTSTHATTVTLNLIDSPGTVNLVAPTHGITDHSVVPTFEWNTATQGVTYTLEVASDAGFSANVYSATVTSTSHTLSTTPLADNTTYYWRVASKNMCGSGSASTIYSFTTLSPICSTPNLTIPTTGFFDTARITDTIIISNSAITINHLNVSISATHGFVGDLAFNLEHIDTGTKVSMIDDPGPNCSQDDIKVFLEDNAASSAQVACNSTPPAIAGILSPNSPLSAFDNENLNGDWRLTVDVDISSPGGTLVEWCLYPTNATIGSVYLPVILKNN